MLSRLLPKSSYLRFLSNISSKSHLYPLPPHKSNFTLLIRLFSTNHGNGNNNNNDKDQYTSNVWKLSRESDENFNSLFTEDSNDGLSGISDSPAAEEESWLEEKGGDDGRDIFDGIEKDSGALTGADGGNEWLNSEEYKMWSLDEGDEKKDNVFDIEEIAPDAGETSSGISVERDQIEDPKMLEKEEKELTAVLKGKFCY